jgi:hypothetical protein
MVKMTITVQVDRQDVGVLVSDQRRARDVLAS